MNRRDIGARALGALLLIAGIAVASPGGSAGSSTPVHDGALVQFGLSIAGLAIACLGVLMSLHGGSLRDAWSARLEHQAHRKARDAGRSTDQSFDPALLTSACFEGRMALTTYLILRSQEQRRADTPKPVKPARRESPAMTLQHEIH